MIDDRPSPDALLKQAVREGRGTLKLFLGAAPGVGKTFEMLSDGAERLRAGVDVVVGVVETHGRAETAALLEPFEVVPRRQIEGLGRAFDEMDLDALLARRPGIALVDELAHTNAPGSRHPKRFQDVEELLAAGIDVYSTLNVQHLESLNDVVASFTKVRVRETVPDSVLDDAEVEVVDIPPDELIDRLRAGKVYVPEEATRALGNFFSKSNLTALRELALRRAAQAIDAQMLDHLRAHALAGQWAAGERVMVAIPEHEDADALVRVGKRLADAWKAPWTAVHIETPATARLGPEAQARLAAALRLATSLGATVASVPAATIIDGLKAHVAEARATQLVVGKARRSRFHELRHGSVVDRLVRETPGVAVHVHPLDAGPRSRPAPAEWGNGRHYLLAMLMVAAVTALGVALARFENLTNIALLYLLPVTVSAVFFGLRPALAAAVASALAYNFFYLPPLYTFTIDDPENVVTLLVLLGVAVLTSRLADRLRAQAAIAGRSARDNAALAGLARQLAAAEEVAAVGTATCAEVARLFDARAVLLVPRDGDLMLVAACPPGETLGALEMAAAKWVLDRARPAGRGSDTLAAADWLFHPVGLGSQVRGVLGLTRDDSRDPVRPDRTPFFLALLDQAALALERIALAAEAANVVRLRERDRLRSTLLSSVSHDLRTPLTAILAAAAELRGTQSAADPATLDALEIEARRLNRYVANLLDMARVEAGALALAPEPVDLAEAVASAAHDMRAALAGHPFRLDVPPDGPFARVDPQLFHHVLINLLDNAGRYAETGAPIAVVGHRTPSEMRLTVLDEGPGLPPGREATLFDTFVRVEGSDRRGGTGLGLAIVKGFAEAMGLSVSAANRGEPRGAAFTIHIPAALLLRADASAA